MTALSENLQGISDSMTTAVINNELSILNVGLAVLLERVKDHGCNTRTSA